MLLDYVGRAWLAIYVEVSRLVVLATDKLKGTP